MSKRRAKEGALEEASAQEPKTSLSSSLSSPIEVRPHSCQ